MHSSAPQIHCDKGAAPQFQIRKHVALEGQVYCG